MGSTSRTRSRPSRRRPDRRLLAIALGCGLLLAPNLAVAQTFTQPQVTEALNQSLDVMKEHVRFLGVQDQYDSALAYYSLTYRVAPVRVAIADGRTPRTAMQRLAQSVGVGFGRPSQYTVFGGAWVDMAGSAVPGTDVNQVGAHGLLFLGAGAAGFQATYGSFVRQSLNPDTFGNYPASPAAKAADANDGRRNEAFSLYHSTGASLVVVRTKRDGEWGVSEVRAQLQPLQHLLGEVAGLPMIAVQRLSPYKSYFGEMRDIYVNNQPSADLGGSAQAQNAPYEVELGSDDLLGAGIRAHVLTRVSPEVAFRRGELGWYQDVGPFTFAGLFSAYMRNNEVQLSGDTFARVAIGDPRPRDIGWPVSFGLSYSYNSPETLTFLPLPYAHVFGFQFTAGVPEIGKALVPIVRPLKRGGK